MEYTAPSHVTSQFILPITASGTSMASAQLMFRQSSKWDVSLAAQPTVNQPETLTAVAILGAGEGATHDMAKRCSQARAEERPSRVG